MSCGASSVWHFGPLIVPEGINPSKIHLEMGAIRPQLPPEAITRYLHNLPLDSYGSRFSFLIGQDVMVTSSFLADLISPMIATIHQQDPTFDSYRIQTTASYQILSTFIQLG
jgi:hypothetical protein